MYFQVWVLVIKENILWKCFMPHYVVAFHTSRSQQTANALTSGYGHLWMTTLLRLARKVLQQTLLVTLVRNCLPRMCSLPMSTTLSSSMSAPVLPAMLISPSATTTVGFGSSKAQPLWVLGNRIHGCCLGTWDNLVKEGECQILI